MADDGRPRKPATVTPGRRGGRARPPLAGPGSTVEGRRDLYDEVETPLVRVLARMEVVGIRVDTDELRRIADGLVDRVRRGWS